MARVDISNAPRVTRTIVAHRHIGSALILPADIYRSALHRYDFEDLPDLGFDW